jgi:hypothetical protein
MITTKHRLEDLGRIAEMVHNLLDNDLFQTWEKYGFVRMMEEVKNEDSVEQLGAHISYIKDKLYTIYDLARWGDPVED